MNKYEYANIELKSYDEALYKNFVKTNQRALINFILTYCIPHNDIGVTIPQLNVDGEYDNWIFPTQRKSESFRGYKSRLMAWALLYIAENFTERLNNEEQEICGFIFPEDVPDFYWEGVI